MSPHCGGSGWLAAASWLGAAQCMLTPENSVPEKADGE